MRKFLLAIGILFAAATLPLPGFAMSDLQKQVADTERAFAKTMASRDHAAFSGFLSEETVFFSGPTPLHGKQKVAEWWKRFYEKTEAPFSWEPEQVEVLDSGTLAISSGPVKDPQGKIVATFTSIWRLEAPNTWRIIFDKGNDICDCGKK
ncbi:MAG: nuclear transport factor 2 family protein [Pseudomonadota bacterium]